MYIFLFSLKLKELGELCGLMPGTISNSEQMHIVISLVCGMGEDPHPDYDKKTQQQQQVSSPGHGPNNLLIKMSPMTRLKEALSSPEAFKKHFLVGLFIL